YPAQARPPIRIARRLDACVIRRNPRPGSELVVRVMASSCRTAAPVFGEVAPSLCLPTPPSGPPIHPRPLPSPGILRSAPRIGLKWAPPDLKGPTDLAASPRRRVLPKGGALHEKPIQRSIELVRLLHRRHVPAVGNDGERGAGNPLVGALGPGERHGWVAVAVDEERRHLELGEAAGEVGAVAQPERLGALESPPGGAGVLPLEQVDERVDELVCSPLG